MALDRDQLESYKWGSQTVFTVDEALERGWQHYQLCSPRDKFVARWRLMQWLEGRLLDKNNRHIEPEHVDKPYFKALRETLFVLSEDGDPETISQRARWASDAMIQGLGSVVLAYADFPMHCIRIADDVNQFCSRIAGSPAVDDSMVRGVAQTMAKRYGTEWRTALDMMSGSLDLDGDWRCSLSGQTFAVADHISAIQDYELPDGNGYARGGQVVELEHGVFQGSVTIGMKTEPVWTFSVPTLVKSAIVWHAETGRVLCVADLRLDNPIGVNNTLTVRANPLLSLT